jgi:hypothetical protein
MFLAADGETAGTMRAQYARSEAWSGQEQRMLFHALVDIFRSNVELSQFIQNALIKASEDLLNDAIAFQGMSPTVN